MARLQEAVRVGEDKDQQLASERQRFGELQGEVARALRVAAEQRAEAAAASARCEDLSLELEMADAKCQTHAARVAEVTKERDQLARDRGYLESRLDSLAATLSLPN